MRTQRILVSVLSATVASAALLATGPAAGASGTGTASDPWDPTRTAHETCSTAHLFGNYTNGQYLDPIDLIPAGDQLDVRYLTGSAALVKWHGHAIWGFTKQSCIAF